MNNDELTNKLNAIRGGDRAAFEELYDDLKTPIYTIICRITWDESTSKDIMQEVFVKLYRSLPGPSVRNPRAYIFQIARNLAIDSMRKQPQHVPLDDVSDVTHQPLNDLALRMDIDKAMKSISAQECQIVTLHVVGELKFREIAEIVKIPLGTALWKYQKAIAQLQRIIVGGAL